MNPTNVINPINSTNPINSKINELPSISIIIPTLNSAKTLEECLESIAMQDYPKDKIEIIIADGGMRVWYQGVREGRLEAVKYYQRR